VDLASDELETARRHGLRVVPSGRSFEQPCAALQAGECSMYDARPGACRRFVCRLYETYRRDGGAIEGPLAVVRRARALLVSVEASRGDCEELTELLEESFGRA
jgi:Fe-S-cluster containining protein